MHLLVVTLTALTVMLTAEAAGALVIRLELEPRRPSLSGPLNLVARITNAGPEPVAIDDPRSSADAAFSFVHQETREDLSFSTSPPLQATVLGGGRQALVVPVPVLMTLGPGESLELRADASERLFLVPGAYLVSFSLGASRSNDVRVSVPLTRTDLLRLLDLAGDVRAPFARREWAVDVLRRLHPLAVTPAEVPDPDVERTNADAIRAFRQWLAGQSRRQLDHRLASITR